MPSANFVLARIFVPAANFVLAANFVCTGWSEPLLVAHTTLSEISCHGSFVPAANYVPAEILELAAKGYFYLCPRMDFLQTLHINNSLYTNYENVFIELDS